MTKDEALKLALEALEEAWYHVGTFQPTEKAIDLYDEARIAIKEALAQPEQEPVAVRYDFDGYGYQYIDSGTGSDWQTRVQGEPLYTAPHPEQYPQIAISPEIVGYVAPQRTWVGLTDEEIDQGLLRSNHALQTAGAWRDGVEWATKQLKEKNT